MNKMLLCAVTFFFFQSQTTAQSFIKEAANAYVITRIAEKIHVSPKPVNDTFSTFVFDHLLEQLDEDRIFFTQKDIRSLEVYRDSLDDEILSEKTNFLQALSLVYATRLHEVDSLVTVVCRKPFSFSANEVLSVAEDTSYPADKTAQQTKIGKVLKYDALEALTNSEDFLNQTSAQQIHYADSIEPALRSRLETAVHRSVKMITQAPGGVAQCLCEEYCKAIALCYDPHTEFFPATEKENFESELGAAHLMFGFTVKEDKEGGVVIDNLLPGSPAFKSGLLNTGDKLEALQWGNQPAVNVSNASVEEISSFINASNHEILKVQVKKADGSVRQVSLVKGKVETEEDDSRVKSFVLKGDKTIGYISLPAFYTDWDENNDNKGCANDVAKEIIKLRKENIQGLILDLRYNGGGSIGEAVELSGIFIDAGPVQQIKGREEKVYTLKDANRGTIYNGPLLILINGYSASASEMVAGTLQDYHRAIIAGSPSYGKATMQIVVPLDTTAIENNNAPADKTYENYLKITTGRIYRISGATAQLTGVMPDILIPDPETKKPETEAANPHALPAPAIEPNKYYQSLPIKKTSDLQTIADSFVKTSPYFIHLTEYNTFITNNRQKKDISLQLQQVLQQPKPEQLQNTSATGDQKLLSLFQVQNNAFEIPYIGLSEARKEANEEWKTYLQKDATLKIAYKVVSALAE